MTWLDRLREIEARPIVASESAIASCDENSDALKMDTDKSAKSPPSHPFDPPSVGFVSAHPRYTEFSQAVAPGEAVERDLWDRKNWHVHFYERAGLHEFDGYYSRGFAERRAWSELQVRWHRFHVKRGQPGICVGCGSPMEATNEATLPDGNICHFAGPEFACLRAYGARWRSEAEAALLTLGLSCPDPPL